MSIMKNKNILICVTGSISAYRACEVIRVLKKEGAFVQVMMTNSAEKFVGKASFAALTGKEVITDLFPKTPKAGLEHIEMAFKLDIVCILPATANVICKAASGIADDIVSTTLSVCEQPMLFVPAMNNRMWQNPATIDAVEKLRERNKIIMDPEEGYLASLHKGEGRLPSINSIMNEFRKIFDIKLPLLGKKILVTAGPTREPIDPVRFISNRSSGKMGYAIAKSARDMGAEVLLVSGPVSLSPIPEVKMIEVETAQNMFDVVKPNSIKADYIFMTAAVADYFIEKTSTKKLRKSKQTLKLSLVPSPDILQSISGKTNATIIAFALETEDGAKNALRKLKEKNADFIVLNYANKKGSGFESNTNQVTIFSKSKKMIDLKKDRKDRIAERIIKFVLNK